MSEGVISLQAFGVILFSLQGLKIPMVISLANSFLLILVALVVLFFTLEHLNKGNELNENYREAMSISADLKCIEKAFLTLSNEGSHMKESVLINAIKGMFKPEGNCTVIGHVIATNYTESLNTLKYLERCKADSAGTDKDGMADYLRSHASDQMLRNLKQINEEYKNEIEQIERKQDNQFAKIKSLLSLDIDIKAMLKKKPTQHDKNVLESYKQAAERVKNFTERNSDLEIRLQKVQLGMDRIKQKIDEKLVYFNQLILTLHKELESTLAKYSELKARYNDLPLAKTMNIEEERKHTAEASRNCLEKKLKVLFSSHETLEQHNQKMLDATRNYETAIKGFKTEYRDKMKTFRNVQADTIAKLKNKFYCYWDDKRLLLNEFMQDAEQYCKKKREYKRQLELELQKMLGYMQVQTAVIRNAEEGSYTEGLKTINIKKAHRPLAIYQTTNDTNIRKSGSTMSLLRPITSRTAKLLPLNTSYLIKKTPSNKKLLISLK